MDLKAVLTWCVENKELLIAVATVAFGVWMKVRELAAKSAAEVQVEAIEAFDRLAARARDLDDLLDDKGKLLLKGLVTEKRLAKGGSGSAYLEQLVKKLTPPR